jgi:hypothetical protein
MEEDMEVLGTWEVQNLCLAGNPKSLLDCGPLAEKRAAAS